MLCDKRELKVGGKTERCIKFTVFKDKSGTLKEPSGKQIEPRALELGKNRIHRLVQGEDLFAREAQYHLSCRKSFNLDYHKYVAKAQKHESDMEEGSLGNAHKIAFNAVLDAIQDRVIGKNEIIQLSSLCFV